MTAFTFEDFINVANGGETDSESLENFFNEPVKPLNFNNPKKQPRFNQNFFLENGSLHVR